MGLFFCNLILAFYSHAQPLSLQNELHPFKDVYLILAFYSHFPTRKPFNPFRAPHLTWAALSSRIEVKNTLSPEQTHFCVKLTLPSPQPPE